MEAVVGGRGPDTKSVNSGTLCMQAHPGSHWALAPGLPAGCSGHCAGAQGVHTKYAGRDISALVTDFGVSLTPRDVGASINRMFLLTLNYIWEGCLVKLKHKYEVVTKHKYAGVLSNVQSAKREAILSLGAVVYNPLFLFLVSVFRVPHMSSCISRPGCRTSILFA